MHADPYADDIRAFAAQVPVVTYAMYNKSADVWPEKMRFSMWETEIKVQTPVGPLLIITPLIGRHNVYNILAAVAVGLAVTVDGEPIPLKVCRFSVHSFPACLTSLTMEASSIVIMPSVFLC